MDTGNVLFGGTRRLSSSTMSSCRGSAYSCSKSMSSRASWLKGLLSLHRQSYACKVGVGDVLIGATQTVAEYNGIERASHVKDKIIEMNHLNETLYCGCIACASEGHKEPSGTYAVDTLLANVHKQNVTRFPYEIARLAQDIGGGLLVTMPSEKDFTSPECGKWASK